MSSGDKKKEVIGSPSEYLCKCDICYSQSALKIKEVDYSVPRSLKTEWLTTEGAAKYLQVSVQSLRNMTSNGKVPYYKMGSRNRYRLADLQTFLLKNPKGGFYGN